MSSEFRSVLSRWNSFPVSDPRGWGRRNCIACRLKHQYTNSNLSIGSNSLKGEDALLMAHLRPIMDELGFSGFLARVTLHLHGPGEDGVDHEIPPDDDDPLSGFILEYTESKLTIQHLVDLDGHRLRTKNLNIFKTGVLVPSDAFLDEKPDDFSAPGYAGNGPEPRGREHWYYRAVLILIPESNINPDIYRHVGGLKYTMNKLDAANPGFPTARDRRIADTIVSTTWASDLHGQEVLARMVDYAIEWKNVKMWEKIGLSVSEKKFVDAWQVFDFQDIKTQFEIFLGDKDLSIAKRIDFLNSLLSVMTAEDQASVKKSWCSAQERCIFEAYRLCDLNDIPYVIDIGTKKGANFLLETILPQLTQRNSSWDTSAFLVEFVKALHDNKDAIPDVVPPPGAEKVSEHTRYDSIIQQCLDSIWKIWDECSDPASHLPYETVELDRLTTFVDVCLTVGYIHQCARLSRMIDAEVKSQIRTCYAQLFENTVAVLHKHNLTISSAPFDTFFRSLVQIYIEGALPPVQTEVEIRSIGCGCQDCQAIDAFIEDKSLPHHFFRMAEPQRTEIGTCLEAARDLVSFTVHTSPFEGLYVTKVESLVLTQKRQTEVRESIAFLQRLKDNEKVLELMGDQAANLLKKEIT